MIITNRFDKKDISNFADQIFHLIKSEPELTNRSLEYIKKMLDDGAIFAAVDKEEVLGFVIKEKLSSNYHEIKSWFVKENKRNSGLSMKIFNKAIENKKHIYIGVTFQKEIIKKLASFNFVVIPLRSLPIIVLIKYIMTRQLKSIIKHSFQRRSYLLIKK